MTSANTEAGDAAMTEESSHYPRVQSSGILVETVNKRVNALHLVCDSGANGFYLLRYDRGTPLWSKAYFIEMGDRPIVGPVIFATTNFHLDALYYSYGAGTLYHTYTKTTHDGKPPYEWAAGWELPEAREVNGTPGVCLNWDRTIGTLDVVAPLASGGFRHWYRDRLGTWFTTGRQYSNQFSGLAIIVGPEKTLFVSAVETNGTLWWITRSADGVKWSSHAIGSGFTGQPALVHNSRDAVFKYDLVVSNAGPGGRLTHFKISDSQRQATLFGVPGRVYGEVGLVANNSGQLECVARSKYGLEHYIDRFDSKGWVSGMPFQVAV